MHLKALFLDYFERDLHKNLVWAKFLEQLDVDLIAQEIKLFSHILNAHHIWNARLVGQEPESAWWDQLSPVHFERLAQDNYQKTLQFIEFSDSFGQLHYYEDFDQTQERISSDILMQILFHSTHHRGQLVQSMKAKGHVVPVIDVNS